MKDIWSMWVYTRAGDLWERVEGAKAELRKQGVGITTLRGQLAWKCSLRLNGKKVAECKRGVWSDAPRT